MEFKRITGTAGPDTRRGTSAADDIDTLGGDDRIRWVGLGDTVHARSGDDIVELGQAGRQAEVYGGEGFDILFLSGSKKLDVDFDASDDRDGIHGFERYVVRGSREADQVRLGAADDEFDGWWGDDRAEGGGGRDLLFGGRDNDQLLGGKGKDRLIGGQGLDELTGGRGADTFHFDFKEGSVDRITDFEAGIDTISVAQARIGNALLSGPIDPTRFREGAATGTEGQFVLLDEGANDRLIWDANGTDAGGVLQIMVLQGDSGLTAGDISII